MKDGKVTIQFSKKEVDLITRVCDEKKLNEFIKESVRNTCYKLIQKRDQIAKGLVK